MGDSSNSPPYPGYGRVDRTLRDSAELDRIRIRDKKRKEWDDTLAALKKLPPSPIHDRGSNDRAAYHTETLMRIKLQKQAARLVAEGKTMVTRSTAATLLAEDPTKASDDSAPRSRKKSNSRNYNAALHEALEAIDQVDSEPSVSCSDSDYEDDKTKGRVAKVMQRKGDLKDYWPRMMEIAAMVPPVVPPKSKVKAMVETFWTQMMIQVMIQVIPKTNRIHHRMYTKRLLRRNKTLVIHSSNQSFQQFSKLTSTSVKVRNKQILRAAKKTMAAGKRKRKDVRLVPKQWETYSETLVCTHVHGERERAGDFQH
ncbi:hypothetical protein GN244_ATG12024 [Phytophthora infestans]|uniref:Uncharacterized protein n=1 Tax=Phytophthora infestans TaxID=4787 RepID=A0A833RZ69_PHYIN|nr:hypothetical protein GN244_ATG12024 [Phytophthora infestans]